MSVTDTPGFRDADASKKANKIHKSIKKSYDERTYIFNA